MKPRSGNLARPLAPPESGAGLHPRLAAWFGSRFSWPTPVQRAALRLTLAGENTLVLAPTGSGKTLAAFLSVLSALAREAGQAGLPNKVRAVYVSPLRALDRDIHRNLSAPLEAVNAGFPAGRQVRMEVRTGDTAMAERSRQQRRRPHLLLTTPESLSSLLSQEGWRGGFAARVVVVDEIHAFAESKRGSFLALALERLEAASAEPLQRIGLSATAHPPKAAAELLCGARPCAVAAAGIRRAHKLDIALPPPDQPLPPAGYNPYRAAFAAAQRIQRAGCTLAFTATRSAAERLGLALKVLLPEEEERIEVHHASIGREHRLRIEAALAAGGLKAVVCSTSLELGVDYAAVDQVLLIGAPRGVSRAVQRLGRSGRRIGGVARGCLIPLSLPDLVECIALREAAGAGRLDELRVPRAPLDVLAQALLGMSIERDWPLEEAFALVRRAGPFAQLPRADFDAVIEYLAGGGRVLGPYGKYGKIELEGGRFRVASRRAARDYYLNIGAISDDFQVKVVTRGNRCLGEVEEGFLSELRPSEAFTIGGRCVKLRRLHRDTATVEPAAGEQVKTPRWMGGRMSLSARLAGEELRLRRALREAWRKGGRRECLRVLRRDWRVGREAAEIVAGYVERQNQAAPVPVDCPLQLERVLRKRTLLLLFHTVAGRAVNRSLAWVAGFRLTGAGSAVANFDDHAFLLSLDARAAPDEERLRAAFDPDRWRDDLRRVLETTETLGRRCPPGAEEGQLLPRRTWRGFASRRAASWSGALLYATLQKHEPGHPLVRETVREVVEDELDAPRAEAEAARIHTTPWEIFDLPRPSPFALPLFAFFNRETLLAQDPDRAVEDVAAALYHEWEIPA